jgi:hypothetical protein
MATGTAAREGSSNASFRAFQWNRAAPFIRHRSKRQGAPPTKGGTAVSKAELLKTATGGWPKKKEKEKKTHSFWCQEKQHETCWFRFSLPFDTKNNTSLDRNGSCISLHLHG